MKKSDKEIIDEMDRTIINLRLDKEELRQKISAWQALSLSLGLVFIIVVTVSLLYHL